MRRAVEITHEAHARAMADDAAGHVRVRGRRRSCCEVSRKHGSERVAYSPIVGSGPNATVLHYRRNNRPMEDGDLLLIDAGASTATTPRDITRTFPGDRDASATRSASIYEIVLEAQHASIEATRPGATFDELHDGSVQVMASRAGRARDHRRARRQRHRGATLQAILHAPDQSLSRHGRARRGRVPRRRQAASARRRAW